jgi:glycosyltransferase involved in cell wall biosynthesis
VAPTTTVAIPVRDGGELLARTLAALARQSVEHELLVCDSGSRDGSIALARSFGARVIEIEPASFGHGMTRNLLMQEASGTHVALLTQDAEPADERWLERLLGAFELGADVAIAYGPYRPRDDATFAVRSELETWFASLSPDGAVRVERLTEHERARPARELIGARGFFTDANACLARDAWLEVPFRPVGYAEDRALAIDMLRAGYAKAFVPAAAVVHSHNYTPAQSLRRAFDEWRALLEVYGWREPASPARIARQLRGVLGAARRRLRGEARAPWIRLASLMAVCSHELLRMTGALLGSRADRLPPAVRRLLSLEHRAGFEPLELDIPLNRSAAQENAR